MQGLAVAKQLLSSDKYLVRAMTRNKNSEVSKNLQGLGAEIVQAELEDYDSLTEAVKDCDGVFIVINFWTIGGNEASMQEKMEGEIRQGKNIIDACKAQSIKHVIYSSVGGTTRNNHPHVRSKAQLEQYLKNSGLSYTILQPVWIMENFNKFSPEEILKGNLSFMLMPDTPFQMLAVKDLGIFTEQAFSNPAAYAGEIIEVAGDELTGEEAALILSDVLERPVTFKSEPMMEVAFEKDAYQADIPTLKTMNHSLWTFKEWAEMNFASTH
jgi:uncharacterized protein YbjT (DUF2867 family)